VLHIISYGAFDKAAWLDAHTALVDSGLNITNRTQLKMAVSEYPVFADLDHHMARFVSRRMHLVAWDSRGTSPSHPIHMPRGRFQMELDFMSWGLIIMILRFVENLTYSPAMGEVSHARATLLAPHASRPLTASAR